ncbi:unnamed protein product [Dovyalis caffra]|uniref:Uncharacterized protein n=1 Tax=Dovyalis caffra TaxID=77055 RepID=A0AAV1RWE2_9ROSI|nr:unnamed protein product [Dovyalis caffra]
MSGWATQGKEFKSLAIQEKKLFHSSIDIHMYNKIHRMQKAEVPCFKKTVKRTASSYFRNSIEKEEGGQDNPPLFSEKLIVVETYMLNKWKVTPPRKRLDSQLALLSSSDERKQLRPPPLV